MNESDLRLVSDEKRIHETRSIKTANQTRLFDEQADGRLDYTAETSNESN